MTSPQAHDSSGDLCVGLVWEQSWTIGANDLARSHGSGNVDVLATPALVAFCEETARKAVEPHLPEGATSVGTRVEIDHLAPTPSGLRVTVKSRLISVDGRRLRFEIEALDEHEPIARAVHERVIVDAVRFEERARAKRVTGNG